MEYCGVEPRFLEKIIYKKLFLHLGQSTVYKPTPAKKARKKLLMKSNKEKLLRHHKF